MVISRAIASSRGHQASPSAPKQRTGNAGQDFGPRRSGRSVKGSRVLLAPGTVTKRVAGSGSKPAGVTGENSILSARADSLWKANAAACSRPSAARAAVSTSPKSTTRPIRKPSQARPARRSRAGQHHSCAREGSVDHRPAIANIAVATIRRYARSEKCMDSARYGSCGKERAHDINIALPLERSLGA